MGNGNDIKGFKGIFEIMETHKQAGLVKTEDGQFIGNSAQWAEYERLEYRREEGLEDMINEELLKANK